MRNIYRYRHVLTLLVTVLFIAGCDSDEEVQPPLPPIVGDTTVGDTTAADTTKGVTDTADIVGQCIDLCMDITVMCIDVCVMSVCVCCRLVS